MKIATVSLNYYTQNNFRRCHTAGARTRTKNVDFAGFSEVRTKNMKRGLREGLGGGYPLIESESAQTFNAARWEHIDTAIELGNKATRGITPALYFVIATYRNRRSPMKIVEVVTTHFVPLTLHGRKRSKYPQRWQMWSAMWDHLKGIVKRAQDINRTVFIVGDFNRGRATRAVIKQISPKAKWILKKGLDWVFVVEGNVRVARMGRTTSFASGSDHRAWARNVILL